MAVLTSVLVQWWHFASHQITTDSRLVLAKAARPDVPVYQCSNDRPRSWEERPPDPDTQPHAVVLAEDFLVAESLEPTTEGSDQWAKVTGVWCEEVPGSEARWEFWGACVRWDDLRPASLDEIGVPKVGVRQGPVILWPPIPRVDRWFAAQYSTEARPAFAVTSAGKCWVYQTDLHGGVKVMVAKQFDDDLMLLPSLRVWPRAGHGGIPDVLAFQPPVGLVCWRWRGPSSLAAATPTLAQLGVMLYMVGRSFIAWVIPLALLFVVYLSGLRCYVSPAHKVPFLVMTTVLVLAALWLPSRYSTLLTPVGAPLTVPALYLAGLRFTALPNRRRLIITAVVISLAGIMVWGMQLVVLYEAAFHILLP